MGEVHIKRDYSIPAAIQFKNPGAMWPGPTATKWGSIDWQYLSDGTGQGGGGHGNKIAIFNNWVDGICAQMDLWRSGEKYRNKTLLDAITIWSGGNHVQSYIDYLVSHVAGIRASTMMNDTFWRGPLAIPFLRAQAAHEAGKIIPATQADYIEAQRRVMLDQVVEPPPPTVHQVFISEVKAFQSANGLNPDGEIGPVTWDKIKDKMKGVGA